MSIIEPSENDESLHQALREWRVTTALPPGFREQVWRRIERAERAVGQAEAPLWKTAADWLARVMVRPVLAVTYVAILLALSLTLGYWHARQATTQWDKDLAQRYVHAVNPYQQSTGN